ncbi:MAG: peptide chain release factor N(5)-glutamine methyltransferase [Candidatus Methylomirabilia bacterium]
MKLQAAETVGSLLEEARELLEAAELPGSARDAGWLLAGLLGDRCWALALEPGRSVSREVAERFRALLARRLRREPLQHLLGWEEFCGLRLRVTPEVLIPRPETELLVEWAVEICHGLTPEAPTGPGGPPAVSRRVAIDLGTGSGAIACALATRIVGLVVIGVDCSARALAVAEDNVRTLGLGSQVRLARGDLFEPVAELAGTADLLIANPPYIPSGLIGSLPPEVRDWEPTLALDGGPDGMVVHRRIIAGAPAILRSSGWLLMELGEGQAEPLTRALEGSEAFDRMTVRRDLAGVERMIGARRR